MSAYGISELEVESCLDHRSSSYFGGADVVYVYNDGQRGMLKVRAKSMFKIQADPEVDAVYIQIKDAPAAYVKEITDDIVVDYTENGEIVGYDFQRFSQMTAADFQLAANLTP